MFLFHFNICLKFLKDELGSWNELWEEMTKEGYYMTEQHTKPVVDRVSYCSFVNIIIIVLLNVGKDSSSV